MGHHISKKEAKKLQNKKNRYHEMLYAMLRLRRAEEVRVKHNSKSMAPAASSHKTVGEWSDKVSTVRNRLTGKKRESKERWNRFAGTSDGGGRGL
jgi:hypothetical protein